MSKRLRDGSLKAVFHGAPEMLTLEELVRCYGNLVGDATRVSLRVEALFRARATPTPGVAVYRASQRKQWLSKLEGGARVRAESLLSHLDVLSELRPKAKAATIAAARRQPGWRVLRTIPFLGPVRVAYLLAIMCTPWRFRTKRNLWPYVGLAVVRQSSADHEFRDEAVRSAAARSQAVPAAHHGRAAAALLGQLSD